MKVIFVCGSSHSGSTLLDLMLSNNKKGLSLGEVRSLFYPTKIHHINPICGCGIRDCPFWQGVKKKGVRRIYENIYERNPHIEFLVDSSKELSWIYDRIEDLDKDEVDYEVIAIWKHPLEIALSLMKRGRLNRFGKVWIDYYNNLASIISDPYAVSYSDLAKDSSICLEQVLNRSGFTYEDGSEVYWRTTYHTLFGSAASRIHLHEKTPDEYKRLMRYISKNQTQNRICGKLDHRLVRYRTQDVTLLPDDFKKSLENNKNVRRVVSWLESRSIFSCPERASVTLEKKNLKPAWYYKNKTSYVYNAMKRMFQRSRLH